MATKRPDPPAETLSSTLRHVKNVQDDGEADVSWANLHDKMVRWVAEATHGQNMPTDKSLDDLTQEVLLTRPAGQAEETAELVRQAGGEPLVFPCLRPGPPADAQPLHAALARHCPVRCPASRKSQRCRPSSPRP